MAQIKDIIESIPYILRMKSQHMWIDYDEEADVLYISFRKPQKADDSEMEGDFIYHHSGKELVGVTVVNAKDKMA